jgi:hypothetical protein
MALKAFFGTAAAFLAFFIGTRSLWAQPSTSAIDRIIDEKSQSEILRQADDMFREISRLRGLPIKHPIQKAFENQAFFRDYYSKRLGEQYPPSKKQGWEKGFQALGLLPKGLDLIETYLNAFMKVVRGLYDPKSKTLFIANWIDSRGQEQTLLHEMVHALQDQYFDLEAYLDQSGRESFDSQFARNSLIEGEATALTLNYTLEDQGQDFTRLVNIAKWAQLNNLFEATAAKAFGRNSALHDVMNFPYVYGAAFLQKYVKAYGWAGLSNLYLHPPTSTRQIIHPAYFFPRRRKLLNVQIEDLSRGPLSSCRKVWGTVLGEYGWTLALRQYLPENEAWRATRGWMGDCTQVYETEGSGRLILVGYLIFDNENSAEIFFGSYRSLLSRKHEIESFRRADDTINWACLAGNEEVYVEQFGRRIVIIERTTPEQTAKVRGALWTVVQKKPGAGKPEKTTAGGS